MSDRKYYTLAGFDVLFDQWEPLWSDHRLTIVQAVSDYENSKHNYHSKLKIITTSEDQASIDAGIAELNK